MANIFGTLNTGYSGLRSSQTAIDVTAHNIANVGNDHYTRQRAVITNSVPLQITPGDLGLGSQVSQIVRIHDEFVFQRYLSASNAQSNSQYKQDIFNTLNTYFPEIDQVGIHRDLQNYFNSWQALSNHPDDGAIKTDLSIYTQTLTNSLQTTREKIQTLQSTINDDIKMSVDEINRLAKGISELNQKINTHEAAGQNANDLRDERDRLEKALNEIVNISVTKNNLSSQTEIDRNIKDYNDTYTLNIGGFNIIDGADFHPVTISNEHNAEGFYEISFKRKDWEVFPMENVIQGGKLGAMLDMRGREFDTQKGGFLDGEVQKALDGLDQFANSLIESTNNLYAQAPTKSMSSSVPLENNFSLTNSDLNINDGSFTINIFNNNGEVIASKEIVIDSATTFYGEDGNSIIEKINSDTDDNNDGNSNNDVDDFILATFDEHGKLVITIKDEHSQDGFSFNITETDPKNPTNFAGALGLQRFFEGNDASDIRLNYELRDNPSKIQAGVTPNSGDKTLANDMQQLQFEKINFYSLTSGKVETTETLERFFTQVAGSVAGRSADVNALHDSNMALYNAVKAEYDSIAKVSIDEELTNLIRFQTGYQAAAKIITTVDQMINSLLQIKS